MQPPSHYDILCIAPTASNSEIKQAYRTLARTHHPDKINNSDKKDDEKFKQIEIAYTTLMDPVSRRIYMVY
jgi:DnaJ-class molecular chaperone